MPSAEVDRDPPALRAVADDLGALAPAVHELRGHVEPATAAAAHFGAPDEGGALAAELAGCCDEVLIALSRVGQRATTLAEELLAGADLVAAADEHSARAVRTAEGQVG